MHIKAVTGRISFTVDVIFDVIYLYLFYFPADETRVVLQRASSTESDFINASYIDVSYMIMLKHII